MKLGLAIVRLVVGSLLFGHGTQKLFGWFGGHGLEGTAGFFEKIGLRPGKRHATVAGASEAAGGVLIATGFLTPVGSALITGVMTQAIKTVHGPKGPWVTQGGWEYNAVLIAAVTAVADVGPGDWSLDHLLGTEFSGPFWALLALGAGVAGPALLVKPAAQGDAPAQQEQREQPQAQGAREPSTVGGG
jgi:putative oxidoreductase